MCLDSFGLHFPSLFELGVFSNSSVAIEYVHRVLTNAVLHSECGCPVDILLTFVMIN